MAKTYQSLPSNQQLALKLYAKSHELPIIQEGTYLFSGTYTPEAFFAHIAKGPERSYLKYRILEGRSIYDIDADLAARGYIQEGEYINYVTNPDKIAELSTRYDFFDATLTSLEGFLYPDTYHLDDWDNLVRQLVSIQLNTFKDRVRAPYANDFYTQGSTHGLSVYQLVTLASIVEKEEKNADNKPLVASVFFNRRDRNMSFGADITLCYYFQKPYAECTASVISKHIKDTNNPYNTRQVAGFPPTPIGNPSVETIKAVLFPRQTSYLFYLHGKDGQIYPATTNAEHEANKQYL
ncbi:endolytic transglycosylase MltG [bacterium]|nr:endolytic transglycosylase MltG [bacterium]